MDVEPELQTETAPPRPPPEFYSVLTHEHPAPREGDIFMVEETHTYWCMGQRVSQSATGVLKKYFPGFDAEGIVNKNYKNWKKDKTSKYNFLISYLQQVEGRDDAFCKKAICQTWTGSGEKASSEGTNMHRDFQYITERLPPPGGETPEVKMFRPWLQKFCFDFGLKPWRAEWNIYYTTPDGRVVVAGQVDLVLQSVHNPGQYTILDYKRKDPQPKKAGGPRNILGEEFINRFTEYGSGPFHEVPATDFGKYTAQLNLYAHIAATQYGIDFRDHMYLLQVHENLDAPYIVGVERMDDVMERLFELELAAFPPVPPVPPVLT